eukprot:6190984-Pleurochrysis_carterae.AAC.2
MVGLVAARAGKDSGIGQGYVLSLALLSYFDNAKCLYNAYKGHIQVLRQVEHQTLGCTRTSLVFASSLHPSWRATSRQYTLVTFDVACAPRQCTVTFDVPCERDMKLYQ